MSAIPTPAEPNASALALAREVIAIEASAVAALADRIDGAFARAVELLLACHGRVVVTGIGAGTTYPDYKPAPFIVSSQIAGADMVTVVSWF